MNEVFVVSAGKKVQDISGSIAVDTTGLATEAKQDAIITAIGAIPGGGGVQYNEGDIDASITGTALLWEDTSDTLRSVSAIATLPVSLASVPSHAVTNAGTFAVQETTYSTSSVTSVAGSASSVQLLASTAGRRGAYFYNDSSAICYLKLGTTASTSSFTIAIAGGGFYELPYPCYTGRIDGIWASATGNMRITEIT